jgi:hypothetical protein
VVHDVAWLRPDPPPGVSEFWDKAYPAIRSIADNLTAIAARDYEILGHFALPEDAWWVEYYGPLEKRLRELRVKYATDDEALALLGESQAEIDMLREHPGWYSSAFFLMRKR